MGGSGIGALAVGGYTTAENLINWALREIGVLTQPGRGASQSELTEGLHHLNRLIASTTICRDKIFTVAMDLFTLTANQQAYTWGQIQGVVDPVADIDLPRPAQNLGINNIVLRLQSSPDVIRQSPMRQLTDEEWVNIRVPSIAAIPLSYYIDGAWPIATIYFYPIPSSAYEIELWTWQQATQLVYVSDIVYYPPGYEDFWLYGLAERLCGPFQKVPSPTLIKQKQLAVDRITSVNSVPPRIAGDPAIARNKGLGGNWVGGYLK